MDAPLNPSAVAPPPDVGTAADAYVAYWDCVECDPPPAAAEPSRPAAADAYLQFWESADA
jgi:hypothetical protein